MSDTECKAYWRKVTSAAIAREPWPPFAGDEYIVPIDCNQFKPSWMAETHSIYNGDGLFDPIEQDGSGTIKRNTFSQHASETALAYKNRWNGLDEYSQVPAPAPAPAPAPEPAPAPAPAPEPDRIRPPVPLPIPDLDENSNWVQEHSRIRSQYAGFSTVDESARKIKDVHDSIRVGRPHVQPNPINKDREKIVHPLNLQVIQVALFTILLGLIILIVLPAQYASGVVFLTLCVGTSAGIYLSTR